MKVILEGSKIKTKQDFHNQIASLLDFGEYYGHNLDALWDRLRIDVERPVLLTWRDHLLSKQAIGEEYFQHIADIFEKIKREDLLLHQQFRNQENPRIFDYSLE
ncbi:barstar family protein [Stenoxybacter acetivorans]|uniref:barstar family protein n=1 Tax=Stenoxybacter acetivorans TaxID=422441 RepID=UPI00056C2A92|nr:barstar family protein [Stenoxybacter acetivorans]